MPNCVHSYIYNSLSRYIILFGVVYLAVIAFHLLVPACLPACHYLCLPFSMFVSHHHSVHHHTTGNHSCTHHLTDPKLKPESSSFVSKSLVAPRSVNNNKLVPSPGAVKIGSGTQSTQHKPSIRTFTSHQALPGTRHQVSSFSNHHQVNNNQLSVSSPVNNRTANTGGGTTTIRTNQPIRKNSPAVKFLFKKPQLPTTISSSSALYHFGSNNNQGNTHSNSLSKFSIPKISTNTTNNRGLNGDLSSNQHSSSSTSGKLLDQSNNRISAFDVKHVNGSAASASVKLAAESSSSYHQSASPSSQNHQSKNQQQFNNFNSKHYNHNYHQHQHYVCVLISIVGLMCVCVCLSSFFISLKICRDLCFCIYIYYFFHFLYHNV